MAETDYMLIENLYLNRKFIWGIYKLFPAYKYFNETVIVMTLLPSKLRCQLYTHIILTLSWYINYNNSLSKINDF